MNLCLGKELRMQPISYHVEDGAYSVSIDARPCGPDMSVTICGGTHPHIGAVALAIPRSSLKDENVNSASVSVLCVTGHKEDELAREAAKILASTFCCRVVVCAGIHIDDAAASNIQRLWDNALSAVHGVISKKD